VGFLDTVRRAAVLLRDEGRVSERALRHEFDLDDQHLDDLVEELVEVRGVATRDGDVLVAVNRPETSDRVETQEPSLRSGAAQPGSADTDRRDLTVLFCDLVGSTELSTRLDSEDYGEAIRVYHEAATAVVTRGGGFVAQLLGDG
jgi:class 3 adenylate cyclase